MNQSFTMEKYNRVISDLMLNLESIPNLTDKSLDQLELSIACCKQSLELMRELVITEGFPDQVCEIHFFKKLKPQVYCKLLYYLAVFEMQSNLPSVNPHAQLRYYKAKLKKSLQFIKDHQFEVQYLQCGFSHQDRSYFSRDSSEIPLPQRSEYYLIDEKFHTWHDHVFSEIMANQMLLEYIQGEISRLKKQKFGIVPMLKSKLRWTGKRVFLVELAYGIYFTGMINNGGIEIKTIIEIFEQLFDVDLKDYSRIFLDARRRKIDRIKYLNIMKSAMENAMDEFDK